MDEILKELGLSMEANSAEVIMKIQQIVSSNKDSREMASAMQSRIVELEGQLKDFSKGIQDVRADAVVRSIQSENGRFLGKDHLSKLEGKAKRYVMLTEEEDKKEAMEDMKALVIAYGVNMNLRRELSSIESQEREDNDDGSSSLDKRVDKLMKLNPSLKFEEATRLSIKQETFDSYVKELKEKKEGSK